MQTTVACDYCHFPVRVRVKSVSEREPEPAYCCFGCRFAAQVAKAGGERGQAIWMMTRLGAAVFLSMGVMVFSLAMYSRHIYAQDAAASSPLAESMSGIMRYASLALATPVLFLLGVPILGNAAGQLKQGRITADVLIVMGVGAAFAYSYVATLSDRGDTYFDTACAILVLVTLGRYLEAVGRIRASGEVEALQDLIPDDVTVSRDGAEKLVSASEIEIGDTFRVTAGDRIPADGTIESGRAHIDEMILTGESVAVEKGAGDVVYAGTLNTDGALTILANNPGSDTAVTRLLSLIEKAKQSKGHYERLADRVAGAFVPLVVVLAAAGAILGYQRGSTGEAIVTGLAVLVVSCPCALGIATPMAIWVGLGCAASKGVLFRNGEAIERLSRARSVAFDKTGTLTTGEPRVVSSFYSAAGDDGESAVDGLALAMARASNHVLSRALAGHLEGKGTRPVSATSDLDLRLPMDKTEPRPFRRPMRKHEGSGPREQQPEVFRTVEVRDARIVAGRGVVANIGRAIARLGSVAMMKEAGVNFSSDVEEAISGFTADGYGIVCVSRDDRLLAVFALSETLRTESARALSSLKKLECFVSILTGDHEGRGRRIAEELGVDTRSQLTPHDKVAALEEFRAAHGSVAMVGDGLNDAPALSAADVGIAMGCGADLSRDCADVCLLSNDLSAVPFAVALARKTVRTIRMNLFWAFAYNCVGVTLAMTGKLNPIIAAGAMVVSSLFVVTNSLRLGHIRDGVWSASFPSRDR